MNFTVEEESLMCVFDISSRISLINSIRDAIPHFDEKEVCEIAENVLIKLETMTDTEFLKLEFSPEYFEETEV